MYYDRELHFMLHDFIANLTFVPQDYAPILSLRANGQLNYANVVPYNQKWVPKRKDGSYLPDNQRESFQPAAVWTEDRWLFCRRMVGDDVCQILFYHLATFIWKQYEIDGEYLNWHQTTLITKVFGIQNVGEFIKRKATPQPVPTWDGKTRVWMDKDQLVNVHREACIFGPMAALFGRELQQFLMVNPDAKLISQNDFQHSVDCGRVSISQQIVDKQEDAEMGVEDDQASQSSKRTRSPRRAWYRDVRNQEVDLRPAGRQGY